MKVVYHPKVQGEVSAILHYYDQLSPSLADDFWEELMAYIEIAAQSPNRFHFEKPNLRRVNLRRFPYHFLYRVVGDWIRITVVRHHRQNPRRGIKRT